jgi:hypothetical protein
MTRREALRLMGVGAVAGTTGRLCFGQSPSFMPDVEQAAATRAFFPDPRRACRGSQEKC